MFTTFPLDMPVKPMEINPDVWVQYPDYRNYWVDLPKWLRYPIGEPFLEVPDKKPVLFSCEFAVL